MSTKIIDPSALPPAERDEKTQKQNLFLFACREIAKTCDKKDIDSLQRASENYLMMCAQYGMKITNQTWYMALGISKQNANQWRNGDRRAGDERYKQLIDDIDAVCSAYREQGMVEGIINPAVAIFHQKIYDGYREDAPVIETEEKPEHIRTAEEIAEKYKYLIEE